MTKIIIISAPSGTGKSSIIAKIIDRPELKLTFSVSATNRPPRGNEKHGIEYYFIDDTEFKQKIAADMFVEYVEVYPGRYYGTLKSELDRIRLLGKNLILDIDVEGALKVKEKYPQDTLAIFIAPPSIEELRKRLMARNTDSAEVIEERLKRASYELSLQDRFDVCFINDSLEKCASEVADAIDVFINKS